MNNEIITNTIFNNIYSRKTLRIVILVTIIVFIVSMWNRYIYIDDAFFGEQAFWLANDGIVKTATLTDFLGTDIHLMSYHKLHIWAGALIIKIFGWSVTPLRVVSLIIYLVFLWVFSRFVTKNRLTDSNLNLNISLFLLIVNPLIILYAFTFRPEIWVMTLGFVSYIFLEKVLNKKITGYLSEPVNVVFAGAFAGFAMLTHLNGLIFPVAGFILLMVNRKWKVLPLFTLSAVLTGGFYFIDHWQDSNYALWLYQLSNWPDNNATNYLSGSFGQLLFNVLIKLSEEHMRFFWSPDVWGISSFFVISLLFCFKHQWKTRKNLIIYLIALILTLNIAGSQIAERFLIYIFPYMVIIISSTVVYIMSKKMIFPKIIFSILFVFQIVTVVFGFQEIFRRNSPHVEISKSILENIPEDKLTLVPYNMIFNSLESHNLTSFKGFEYYEVYQDHKLTQEEVFNRANEMGIQYIVVPTQNFRNTDTGLKCFNNPVINQSSFYNRVYEDARCIILKSNTTN